MSDSVVIEDRIFRRPSNAEEIQHWYEWLYLREAVETLNAEKPPPYGLRGLAREKALLAADADLRARELLAELLDEEGGLGDISPGGVEAAMTAFAVAETQPAMPNADAEDLAQLYPDQET